MLDAPSLAREKNMMPLRMGQSVKGQEMQWRQNLQEQARNWQLTKSNGRYYTDQGVPVVRRHKRSITNTIVA
jgi:hypothetical protein